ncbi:MAG TPA: ferrochelatase [Acidobacteriaceae bacterium]|jgi:ferrochelatase|nr:ferrochelatase [Acidobacteriaceae bacterium]
MADGVLLLAHGTADSVEEIPEYLNRVTQGRPLPEAAVEEVKHRFSAIGGSPLTRLTLEQGRLLADELGMPVYVGMRNWKPYIADVVHTMREEGITRAVAICLAPQNSRTSVGLYRKAVFAAAEGKLELHFVEHWAEHPDLIRAFAERLVATRDAFSAEVGSPVPVLFTAHSVPCRTVISAPQPDPKAKPEPPDPYPVEAKRTAELVAERTGLALDQWFFAFQSQGMSGGPWLGPTVEDTLRELREKGVTNLIIQPIGFLCDHVEILYDIDVAFRECATGLGMTVRRPDSLNDSRLLTLALADIARRGLASQAAESS